MNTVIWELRLVRSFLEMCPYLEKFPGPWISEGTGDLEGSQEMVAVGSVPSRNVLFLCLVHHKIFSAPEKSISREISREIYEI